MNPASSPPNEPVRPSRTRAVLLWGVPLVAIVVGLFVWGLGGRLLETDNAYLKSDIVTIYPEVEGTVQEVLVAENASVAAGQLLVKLDRAALELDVERAAAQLESLRAEFAATFRQYEMRQGMLKVSDDQLRYLERELQRQRELLASKLTSTAKYDAAEHDVTQARAQRAVVEQAILELKVRLGEALQGHVEKNPRMRDAQAALDAAKLRLQHAGIVAPVAGRVAKVPQPGTLARRGVALLTLVRADDLWVEANFKETQVGMLRQGLRATVRIDAFPGQEWQGHVDTISPASGSEFAVLPAQNASGNWVKIVQRVPVRIAIDGGPKDLPLRAGMSALVSVDPQSGTRWTRFVAGL
ncbi:MAG: HlyD family secretion protein [Steroidobacteraceae bacterium]|jgi:membrane fusion protein (multidrug efflux system)